MNFEHPDSTTAPVAHPREDAAEAEKTSDLDVGNTKAGNESSTTESKGGRANDEVKEGHSPLLDFDPYGRKSPDQVASASSDRDPVSTPGSNAFELTTNSGQDADIFRPEEKDQNVRADLEDSISSQLPTDSPTTASTYRADDPFSSSPADSHVHENIRDESFAPIRSDAPADPVFDSFGGSAGPTLDQAIESGAVGPENPHPGDTHHKDEHTSKSDSSFQKPSNSADDDFAEVGGKSSDSLIPDLASQSAESAEPAEEFGNAPPSKQAPAAPELIEAGHTPALSKADSPVLETGGLGAEETSGAKPESFADDLAAEIPVPYVNPDPFQDYIPPVEEKELGDHKAARIPSPSSMDAEPPTPVDRSTLGDLKETGAVEPAEIAERIVDELPLEALRNRDVQEALASVIPPAPDKPLPPTPGSEAGGTPRRAAARAGTGIGHLPVMEILLWRDPKKSGAAFATGLVVLVSMMYFSFISVVAYFALALLTVTLGFRLYKVIMGMVQKTNDGHPFQDLLSVDTTVTNEKGHELADKVVAELNCCSSMLKDLFLVKDIFESVKFGFVLYLLTYLGAWFNTMTLVIMAYVAMFTLPKVYEQNKEKIDEVLGQIKEKVGEVSAKVKAAIPMGKKAAAEPVTEEKKEE